MTDTSGLAINLPSGLLRLSINDRLPSGLLIFLLGMFMIGGLSAQEQYHDWTHWRGPYQNGVSLETDLVDSFSLETGENVLWTADVGGRSTPIVMDDKVYINCRTLDDEDPQRRIYSAEQVVCMDANTGEVLWRDRFNVYQTDIPTERVGWAAMCADEETGYVYAHSVSGRFCCYTADGEIVWKHSLMEEYGKISGYGGRTQTPIIDEDRVIVSYLHANWGETKGPAPVHAYYAFDKRSGDLLWVSAPGGRPKDTNYSVPLVTVIDGRRLLIGGNSDGGIYAINARTGAPVWQFNMSQRGLNTSPVVDGNRVYISHGEDNIDNTEFGRVQCIDGSGTGDITETGSVWRVDSIKAGYTGLLIRDGILYVVTDTGNLIAFDGQSGEQLWDHKLGTVGKGSPVWADGKIYVMEVNGRIIILKPSRNGCQELCRVHVPGKNGGDDEIYASPAISKGRIFLVTRDRTICIGKTKQSAVKFPPRNLVTAEAEPTDEISLVQLRPYEVALDAGDTIEYTAVGFDQNGREVKRWQPELQPSPELADLSVQQNRLSVPRLDQSIAGTLSTTYQGITATARVRAFNANNVWTWDFEGMSGVDVPPEWMRAFAKLKPAEIDGNTVMKASFDRGRPSHVVFFGKPEMTNYTVQADVRFSEQSRRRPRIGIIANRYTLLIKADDLPRELQRDRQAQLGMLSVQTWAPELRLDADTYYPVDIDTWYTLKLKVEIHDDEAHIFGKAWNRDEPEPHDWTLTKVDPSPNRNGSPGLYVYALADCFFDNVQVIQHDQ